MKAIVSKGNEQIALGNIAKPVPGPKQMLVRVIAAGGNISDQYKISGINEAGRVLGADYAGYVEECGSEVPVEARRKGERVAGFVVDMSKEINGTYAEYCIADPFTAVVIPEDVTFEQAATIGLSGFTASQTLFQSLKIETPLRPSSKEPREHILIWGAATILGMYAVQLATLSGYDVVATASRANFDFLKSLGASVVFDYSDADVSQKIKEYTHNRLALAVDCISDVHKDTPRLVAGSFGSQGGRISTVLPFDADSLQLRKDVEIQMVLVYTLLGAPVDYPVVYPAMDDHHADGKQYAEILSKLLLDKKLRPAPVRVVPNGLAGVADGLSEIVAGKVRAQKLVYRIQETP